LGTSAWQRFLLSAGDQIMTVIIQTVRGIGAPGPVGPPAMAEQNITVSLPAGVTFGKYSNGQVMPTAGKSFEQILRDAAIAEIAPTYTPATISLSQSAAPLAEVGTAYTNNLTAAFAKNDAGNISAIRIEKKGVQLGLGGSSSSIVRTDTDTYPPGVNDYIAFANYAAGSPKNYTPSGTPDARTPAVRTANAPQAAENNFASATVTLTGQYKLFYGPASAAPANSATVRALPSNRFTGAGNTFTLNTGTTQKVFAIAMPATMSLVSVIDADALNANITSNYVLSTFSVNDAGGNAVSYKVYVLTNAVPYPSSHQHLVTVA
jgi:hypothetical protein